MNNFVVECITPDPAVCLPPFDQLQFIQPYTREKPFGLTSLYQIDEQTSTITGTFLQAGLFSYGIHIEQLDGNNFISKQILDYSLLINFSPETSLIAVKTYIDKNENGIKDNTENYIDFYDYELSQPSLKTTVRSKSKIFNVDLGEYEIVLNDSSTWKVSSETETNVDELGKTHKVDLGIVPNMTSQNAYVEISAPFLVCSNKIDITIDIYNQGTTLFNGELIVALDQELSFLDSNVSPTSQLGNQLVWDIKTNLDLFENMTIIISVAVPNEDFIDLPMTITSVLKNESGDIVNGSAYHDIVKCSFDPNDKMSYSDSHHYYTLYDDYLYYTIRFENTGNFPATDITIKDNIDQNLDIRTFQFLGSSVPAVASLIGNDLSFIWDNILLPPSEIDSINGHGYVRFKIKPLPGLAENTILKNTAQILFDNNVAITTNTTRNELVSSLPLTGTDDIQKEKTISISPNPNRGSFTFHFLDNKKQNINISIIDSQGKEIYRRDVQNNQLLDLDLNQGTYFVRLNSSDPEVKKLYPVVVIK